MTGRSLIAMVPVLECKTPMRIGGPPGTAAAELGRPAGQNSQAVSSRVTSAPAPPAAQGRNRRCFQNGGGAILVVAPATRVKIEEPCSLAGAGTPTSMAVS